MENYKMDRTIATKLTFKQADDHVTFYKDKTPLERLNHACDIINSIFNSNPNLKVDRTIITSRKHAKSI
jgi:hypothetical protein